MDGSHCQDLNSLFPNCRANTSVASLRNLDCACFFRSEAKSIQSKKAIAEIQGHDCLTSVKLVIYLKQRLC